MHFCGKGLAALQASDICLDTELSSLISLLDGYLATCRTRLDAIAARMHPQLRPAGPSSVPESDPSPAHADKAPAAGPCPASDGSSPNSPAPHADHASSIASAPDAADTAPPAADGATEPPDKGPTCSLPAGAETSTVIAEVHAALATGSSAHTRNRTQHGGASREAVSPLESGGPAGSMLQRQPATVSGAKQQFLADAVQYLTEICRILTASLSALTQLEGQRPGSGL